MPIYHFVLFLSTIFIFNSCSKNNINSENDKKLKFDSLSHRYDIDFNVRQNGGEDLIFFDSTFYKIFDFCGDKTIKSINLKNNKLTILSYDDPNCGQVYTSIKKDGYYIISVDNKVFYYPFGESIGNEITNLNSLDSFKNSGLTTAWHKVWGNQHVNVPDDILYFRLERDLNVNNGKYSLLDSLYPMFAKFNLKTKKISFFGHKPEKKISLLPQSYELYLHDTILVNFSHNTEIIQINTVSRESIKHNIKSKFDTVPIKELVFDEATYTIEKNKKYSLENANYGPLYYNPYNNYYYRIFHPFLPERDKNGKLNTEFDKECVLMIIDNNFKIKKEVILPVKGMRLMTLIPIKNGVEFYRYPEHITQNGKQTTFNFLKYQHK